MKRLITLAALFFTLASFAQDRGHISGRIADGSARAVEAATISLLRAADSSTMKLALADKDGNFSFEGIAAGRYLVGISATGHQPAWSPVFELDEAHRNISLATLQLRVAEKQMTGVIVTAKRPLVEHKIDRTLVNVDASITNTGSTALDVLEKSPGVLVDKDGNISLKGKEGVLVLIDGRPTQLSGADLANLLRTMSASQLDQLEIMTNPPAKYDAAGNAGIINIKTKKIKQAGYNGSVNLGYGQGRFPKFNESVNMNYRQGKVNVFTSLSHNYRRRYQDLYIQRYVRDQDTKQLESYFDQHNYMNQSHNDYSAKLGVDYAVTSKTTIGAVVNGYREPGSFRNNNLNYITDRFMVVQNVTSSNVSNKDTWKNFSANLNFRTQLDTAGRELSADLDYIRYGENGRQLLQNTYGDAQGRPLRPSDTLIGNLPQYISIYSGRVDYVQPLKKGARFEAGLKSSVVRTSNDAGYDSVLQGQIVHDYSRSNYFVYQENINAAYVNMSAPLSKKWNAQLGLRLENTNATGEQRTTGETFSRHYTQLFPTAFVQYQVNEKNNFGLNFGRRISRPNYQSLNPFVRFLDRYTYMQGNPNLKPQFSNNIELSHSYKNILTTTLSYSLTTDIIQGVIHQKGTEAYAMEANIASARQFGLEISANHPITKWWTSSTNANVFHNYFRGDVDGAGVSVKAFNFFARTTQQFKISKTFAAELNGFFVSGGLHGIMVTKPFGELSLGLSQQVLKGKGSLRLNVSDILKTQRHYGRSQYGNTDVSFTESGESRVVNLGFSFRFGKGKASGERRRNSSAGDEQDRVGH